MMGDGRQNFAGCVRLREVNQMTTRALRIVLLLPLFGTTAFACENGTPDEVKSMAVSGVLVGPQMSTGMAGMSRAFRESGAAAGHMLRSARQLADESATLKAAVVAFPVTVSAG
jgi:hypothetical protein